MKVFNRPFLIDRYFDSLAVFVIAEDIDTAIKMVLEKAKDVCPEELAHRYFNEQYLRDNADIYPVNNPVVNFTEVYR